MKHERPLVYRTLQAKCFSVLLCFLRSNTSLSTYPQDQSSYRMTNTCLKHPPCLSVLLSPPFGAPKHGLQLTVLEWQHTAAGVGVVGAVQQPGLPVQKDVREQKEHPVVGFPSSFGNLKYSNLQLYFVIVNIKNSNNMEVICNTK